MDGFIPRDAVSTLGRSAGAVVTGLATAFDRTAAIAAASVSSAGSISGNSGRLQGTTDTESGIGPWAGYLSFTGAPNDWTLEGPGGDPDGTTWLLRTVAGLFHLSATYTVSVSGDGAFTGDSFLEVTSLGLSEREEDFLVNERTLRGASGRLTLAGQCIRAPQVPHLLAAAVAVADDIAWDLSAQFVLSRTS